MSTNLQSMLTRVREGVIDFSEFVAKTRTEFRRMALYLLSRWVSPVWYTPDDVEQELYLGVWNHIWRYEPCLSNGVSFARYIVYNAMAAAKIQLHKARGVTISGSPDKKQSNIETPLALFGDENEGQFLLESILAEPAIAEEAMIEAEIRKESVTEALMACETKPERFAILAIREAGTLDSAGQLLYDDFDHRVELRLGSEKQATRFVFRHASVVAKRMAQQDSVI